MGRIALLCSLLSVDCGAHILPNMVDCHAHVDILTKCCINTPVVDRHKETTGRGLDVSTPHYNPPSNKTTVGSTGRGLELPTPSNKSETTGRGQESSHTSDVSVRRLSKRLRTPSSEPNRENVLIFMLVAANAVTLMSCVCCMHNGGHQNHNHRFPPQWAPSMEPSYTFAMWQRDVLLWTIANGDIEPHRQAAMLLMQLRGGARELTRDMPDDIVLRGIMINGQRVDGMTYIMNILAERYAQLGEETRLKAIRELMEFDKRNNEKIDDLITRFEILRWRAAENGGFVMSVEGLSYMLMKSCRVNDQQFIQLLQPTQGRFPRNDAELRAMYGALRRMGHILERTTDNIAQGLRAAAHTTRSFMVTDESDNLQAWNPPQTSWSYPTTTSGGWGDDSWQQSDSGWNLSTWGENAYMAQPMEDSGTDTDTVSSVGDTHYAYDDVPDGADVYQTAELLFWSYQQAKGRYRKFMRKPVRRVRRFMKRKGKGKGKHPGFFLQHLTDQEVEQTFFGKGPKGRGKGKGKRSTGKGRGRRQNPKGPDGKIMTCRQCGSTEHFQKECPRNQSSSSSGGPGPGAPNFFTHDSSEGPLTSLLNQAQRSRESVFMISEITDAGEERLERPDPLPTTTNSNMDTSTDPWVENDPWRNGRLPQNPTSSNSSVIREMPWTNWMPTNLVEEHQRRTQGMQSELLRPLQVPLIQQAEDLRVPTVAPHPQPTVDLRVPMWATMPLAANVRGTWRITEPEPAPAPPTNNLYRTQFENVDTPHESVANRFHRRFYRDVEPDRHVQSDGTRLGQENQKTIDRFKHVQEFTASRRKEVKKESDRRSRVKFMASEAVGLKAGQAFNGSVNRCTICLDDFKAGDEVSRLTCMHVLHVKCLTEYHVWSKVDNPLCPECRGPTTDPRNYVYVSEGQFNVSTAASEVSQSSDDDSRTNVGYPRGVSSRDPMPSSRADRVEAPLYHPFRTRTGFERPSNTEDFFPWWQVDELCYHGATQLSDGRQGLLVDPGAWSNLVGETWARNMAKKALAAGHKPKEQRMDKPLNVAGVGTGTNSAEWEVNIPIAVGNDDDHTIIDEFRAPSVTGPGKDLPALLGLKSMSLKKGVLEMTDGEEYLTFPGPGGYKIEWSPGTRRMKLERAPSGHLVLPCDSFERVSPNTGGLPEKVTTFFSDKSWNMNNKCSVETQTDVVEKRVKPSPREQETTR